jgi:hypothetical protein
MREPPRWDMAAGEPPPRSGGNAILAPMTALFRLTEFAPATNAGPEHPKLGLRPTRDDGNEFTVLIGPNGTGKSACSAA